MNSTNLGAIIIEGHVQGLSNTRALGEAGIPVYVIDKNICLARFSKYCKKFFICPDFISNEFAPFLIDLAIKENLRGWALIPSNDHAVYSISKNKAELEQYFKIITPELNVVEKIYDKSALLTIAEKLNIPYPKTQYFKSPLDRVSVGLPLITKGKNGLSFYKAIGNKALLANSEEELRTQLELIDQKFSVDRTFTQELIPYDGTNKTISFTAFCIAGEVKTYWIGEKIREHPIRFGTATFARSIECKQLLESSQKLLKEINYTGVCEVEYLLDPRDKEFKLIEINARTWLWVGLAKACGINYTLMIYNYLNGIDNVYPKHYKIGVNWVNYVTDTPFSLIAILKSKISVKQYFSSFKGKKVDAFFSWKDLKPSIMFFVLSFYIAIKR